MRFAASYVCFLVFADKAVAFSGLTSRKNQPSLLVSPLQAATIPNTPSTTVVNGEIEALPSVEKVDAVICGGGPAGLLTAIMFSQTYPTRSVRVYDRLSPPPGPDDAAAWSDVAKFYLIGLGERGQNALRQFGVWDDVERRCVAVVGRKNWEPGQEQGVERVFTKKDKPVTTQVLPRDKLVGILHKHILDNYEGRIQLEYGYELRPLDFAHENGSQVMVEVVKCTDEIARLNPSAVKTATEEPVDVLCDTESYSRISADLLVAADGTVRTIANAIEEEDRERFAAYNPLQRLVSPKPFRVKRYVDDNQRIYKTIPFRVPEGWRGDLNYSARTKDGRIAFDALPATNEGDYCGVLLLKKDDPLASANTDPKELRAMFDDNLPQFSELLDDETIETIARKPVSYLPGFRYPEPRLHQGNRCVILGDCAHTVKPYFGLGANSALGDVKILSDILDSNRGDLTSSVLEYSKKQAGEAKALVRLSRELDRPGKLGLVTFIIPLILDSIFFGLMPKLFTPNIIAMLQKESYTFQQVGRRKRFDRLMQVSIIGLFLSSMFGLCRFTLKRLIALTGLRGKQLVSSVVLAMVSVAAVRKIFSTISPDMTPGDIVARFGKQASNTRTQHLMPRFLRRKNKKGLGGEKVGNGESFLTPLSFGNKDEEKK